MKKSTSAGGVVFLKKNVLLLMKNNGDWVLPKGHIEKDEHRLETALREVQEEAAVNGIIHEYLGSINYEFYDIWQSVRTNKTVHWYLMTTRSSHCFPQQEEGFKRASFVPIDDAVDLIRYNDERGIVAKAIAIYRNKYLSVEWA